MKPLSWLPLLQVVYAQTLAADTTPSESTHSQPTCVRDYFWKLRPSPHPTCSLSMPPSETQPEFLSFEVWKARQLANSQGRANGSGRAPMEYNGTKQPGGIDVEGQNRSTASPSDEGEHSNENNNGTDGDSGLALPRVPLTDRFNYAAQDCTARIHASHKGAKSPSSILNSKRDRYMLSPCGAKSKFVIVELCDDVRIDTVQLANFEFFSGVFKDFRISLAETSPGDPKGWIDAGTYRGKNIRGVQSFHPPQGRQLFYRYIRIDFLSHYGAEFYCPVSLLRVYGLTHMEDYKWAGWQTGHETDAVKEETPAIDSVAAHESIEVAPSPVSTETPAADVSDTPASPQANTESEPLIISPASDDTKSHQENAENTFVFLPSPLDATADVRPRHKRNTHIPRTTSLEPVLPTPTDQMSRVSSLCATPPSSSAIITDSSSAATEFTPSPTASPVSPSSASPTESPSPSPTQEATHTRPSHSQVPIHVNTGGGGGGESIYRTIMNRLSMLELNSTLSVRYVEEQAHSISELVRKLEEDMGRLNGFTKRQQQMLQRALLEMDKRREESEKERLLLLQQVNALSEEVVLEKRLGIAQLCLLLLVLIFMAFTRGSSGGQVVANSQDTALRRARSWRPSWRRGSRAESITFDEKQNDTSSPVQEIEVHESSPDSPLSPSPESRWPAVHHSQHARSNSAHRTPRVHHNQSRQRVISFPALPNSRWPPKTASYATPQPAVRRLAPHLHEVKSERPKRRVQPQAFDLGLDLMGGGRDSVPSDGEGTPRLPRIARSPLQQQTLPPRGSQRSRSKGTERVDGDRPSRHSRLSSDASHGTVQANGDREFSPSSTVAAGSESEDSAAWEDTTASGDDSDAGAGLFVD